jgi:UDP-N-acetylmuramoylalanine--D-glutamate ligase
MSEKILVLGLSKSGIAAAKLAVGLGYDVYLTESKSEVNELQVKELENLGIKVEYGKHSQEFVNNASFAITSPGIPPKSDIFNCTG